MNPTPSMQMLKRMAALLGLRIASARNASGETFHVAVVPDAAKATGLSDRQMAERAIEAGTAMTLDELVECLQRRGF